MSTPVPSPSPSPSTPTPPAKGNFPTWLRITCGLLILPLFLWAAMTGFAALDTPGGVLQGLLYAAAALVGIAAFAAIAANIAVGDWLETIYKWAGACAALMIVILVLYGTVGHQAISRLEAVIASDPALQAELETIQQTLVWKLFAGGTQAEVDAKNAAETGEAAGFVKFTTEATTPGTPTAIALEEAGVKKARVASGLEQAPQDKKMRFFGGLYCMTKLYGMLGWVGSGFVIAAIMGMIITMWRRGVVEPIVIFTRGRDFAGNAITGFNRWMAPIGKIGLFSVIGWVTVQITDWVLPASEECVVVLARRVDDQPDHRSAPVAAPTETHAPKPAHSQKKSVVAEACAANCKDFAAQGIDLSLLPRACR